MDCLDANTVQDLMAGGLDSTARGTVLGHLDTCEDCRELLGATARHELVAPVEQGSLTRAHETLQSTTHDGFAALAPVLAAGSVLGRYELDERIGAGAMGVVWRAHDPKLGRRVALKLLRRRDEVLTERLVREAQSMAQVNHPHVVAVYDVGTTGGATYIAMELVEGQSLRAWQTAKARTIPEIVGAYVAAGRGLAAAHGAGIVHRDFKADNVLVGSDGRVRVTDFGLAAAQVGEASSRTPTEVDLTSSGSVLGTPAYMAPEQFRRGNVDPRTDQFNFCAALYEALYGERPFAGTKYEELAENVIAGRVQPAAASAHVSRGLRAIVVRGLAAKPIDRFPSMDQLLAELGRDRARPWRRLAIGSAALAAALVLGVVADWAVRDRVTAEIRTSFALTGKELDRTTLRLLDYFRDSSSELALREPALRELAGHRDQADFGLGSATADREELERLHGTFVSAELPKLGNTQLAIVDYKGRLMYSSYAPGVWNTDMRVLPQIRAALDAGQGRALNVQSYADLAPTKMMGNAAHEGLVLVYLQTLALGETPEARAIYLVLEDGKLVLDDLRLDTKTALALVAPDGTTTGDSQITPAQIAAARASDGVTTVGDHEVQARPLLGLDDKPIATVVMARRLDGVLTFFPAARLVFALAALVACMVAAGAIFRARDGVH